MPSSKRQPSMAFLALPFLIAGAAMAAAGNSPSKHPIPPVAMPGILTDHMRSIRNIHPAEIYSVSIESGPQMNNLIRMKRSPSHPIPFLEIPMRSRRNKRDLRRLRRDLGYATDFGLPARGARMGDYVYGAPRITHPKFDLENDLAALLESADRLSILKQMQGMMPYRHEKHWPLHAPPSRFAPQPKLFDVKSESNFHPARAQATPLGWAAPNTKGDEFHWMHEKRSMPYPGNGLSMIPGFKRSVFREATRKHDDSDSALSSKEIMTLASILGAEVDPQERRIRRTAM